MSPRTNMAESWLILETSSRVAKVGLARAGSIVRAVALDDSRRHARDLASTVETLLKDEALKPAELTGVMVGRGPGSYTGLRVGLMSAKALAYATGCELRAVDTFAAIAEQSPAEAREVWVLADALQGMVYIQRFTRNASIWSQEDDLRIERVEDAFSNLNAESWLSGPGVKVYAERIPPSCRLVPEADREPRIESVFAVGTRMAPLAREPMLALEPLYLRGSSAEEKARGK